MKRSLATSLAVAVASPLVMVAALTSATPAQAALPCDTPYPAGSSYLVTTSPANVTIRLGSQTFLYGHISRGQTGCNGQVVRFWARNSSQLGYTPQGYSITGNSDLGSGFIQRSVRPTKSFRWFIQFRTTLTASSLVTVRR